MSLSSSSLAGCVLLVAGVVLLVFVAMSGMQWKELLRAQAGASFELNSLPSDVYAAAALAFSLCLAGTVLLSSNFRPVMKTGEAPHDSFHRLFGPSPDGFKFPTTRKAA